MSGLLNDQRRALVPILVPTYLVLIYGVPTVFVGALVLTSHEWQRVLSLLLAPAVFTVFLSLTAGALSRTHQKSIVAGKFPRDVGHPIYFDRRMYGLCWTSLFYCKPVYFLCLTVPALKTMTFRLFGYKGEMDFTVYPDTWIRDLPLLSFGKGAYIANRSTLGTNLALPNGDTMVAPITIGEGALVGHLVAIACGSSLGDGAEIGACSAIGYKTSIGDRANISASCNIEHGVQIGADCAIGATTYIGSACRLAPGVRVLPGAKIPPRTRIDTSDAALKYVFYLANKETGPG
jgi:carbonic anhydrase/acetyltransferase-like protein (isoleucine patch superfamily)